MNWLRLRTMREDDLPWVVALERDAPEVPWREKRFREALAAGDAVHRLSGSCPVLLMNIIQEREG